jgi:hypothetical protein
MPNYCSTIRGSEGDGNFNSFGQDPTPGKYSCSIANIVGLKTDLLAERQKFFVTIENNKQQPEDWCFSAEALDNLKKLRRGVRRQFPETESHAVG